MALSGMTFVITGKSALVRKDLEKKIKDAGGIVSARLSKKVTHCLCGEGFADTDKYRESKDQGVAVVTEDFIDACIRNHAAGAEKPEEKAYEPGKETPGDKETENSEHERDKEPENDKASQTQNEPEANTNEGQESSSQKSRSPRKKRAPVDLVSSVLSGWVLVLDGRFSKPHSEITQFIESHGGKVSSSLSSGKGTRVTHLLSNDQDEESQKRELAKDGGVTIIDEDYLEWFVEDAAAKERFAKKSKEK